MDDTSWVWTIPAFATHQKTIGGNRDQHPHGYNSLVGQWGEASVDKFGKSAGIAKH